ncbi:MAG: O-antigen ligase family protein [Elusimicrobiales bacterium]|nr:O-antigen ligase family protein [Elusimicrobiales bacterium]
MPIIIVLLALAAAGWLGFMAAAGAQYSLILLLGALIVGLFAFFSPKLSLVLLVFSMLLSPEINLAGLAGSGRNIVVRYDDILLLIIFFSWLGKTAIVKDKPLVFRSPVQNPILLYTFVCVLSTAFGVMGGRINWETAIFYILKYVEYFLLYFMVFNIIESKEEVRRYLKAGAVVAALVTVYAVWYYFNAGPGARASTPFEAPLGNPEESEPASLGGYYLIVFGLIFGVISEMPFRTFAWAFASMAAMLPAFILTLSRASYIGLAFSGLAAIFLSRQRRLFLISVTALGVLGISLSPFLAERAKVRVQETYVGNQANTVFNTPVGEIRLEESAALRVRSWQRSVFYWLPKNVLIGNGVTGVGLSDAQVPLVIAETGVVGLVLWVWMIVVCFKVSWRLYHKSDDPFVRTLSLGYIIGLIGLLWQSIGVNTFIIVRIMEPFWFLTAIIMKLAQLEPEGEKNSLV